MSYRPQFAYPQAVGFEDEAFSYSFDATNTPALTGTLAAATSQLSGIPLPLQQDSSFLWRAIKVELPPMGAGSNLYIQFKDCQGNYLTDTLVPIDQYAAPTGLQIAGTGSVVLEPERPCPAGGVITVYFQNATGGALSFPKITLLGVKRFAPCAPLPCKVAA